MVSTRHRWHGDAPQVPSVVPAWLQKHKISSDGGVAVAPLCFWVRLFGDSHPQSAHPSPYHTKEKKKKKLIIF